MAFHSRTLPIGETPSSVFQLLCPFRVEARVNWENDLSCGDVEPVISMILRKELDAGRVLNIESKSSSENNELNLIIALLDARNFEDKFFGKSFASDIIKDLHVTFESFADTMEDYPRLEQLHAVLDKGDSDCLMFELPLRWVFPAGVEDWFDMVELPTGRWHTWFGLFGPVKRITVLSFPSNHSTDQLQTALTCQLCVQFEVPEDLIKCASMCWNRILINVCANDPSAIAWLKFEIGLADNFVSVAADRRAVYLSEEAKRNAEQIIQVLRDLDRACSAMTIPKWSGSMIVHLFMEWIESGVVDTKSTIAISLTTAQHTATKEKNAQAEENIRVQSWIRVLDYIFRFVSTVAEPSAEMCICVIKQLEESCLRFNDEKLTDEEHQKFVKCMHSMLSSRIAQDKIILHHKEQEAMEAEEALLRELDECDKKKKKSSKKSPRKKRSSLLMESTREHVEQGLRRAPSPTRSAATTRKLYSSVDSEVGSPHGVTSFDETYGELAKTIVASMVDPLATCSTDVDGMELVEDVSEPGTPSERVDLTVQGRKKNKKQKKFDSESEATAVTIALDDMSASPKASEDASPTSVESTARIDLLKCVSVESHGSNSPPQEDHCKSDTYEAPHKAKGKGLKWVRTRPGSSAEASPVGGLKSDASLSPRNNISYQFFPDVKTPLKNERTKLESEGSSSPQRGHKSVLQLFDCYKRPKSPKKKIDDMVGPLLVLPMSPRRGRSTQFPTEVKCWADEVPSPTQTPRKVEKYTTNKAVDSFMERAMGNMPAHHTPSTREWNKFRPDRRAEPIQIDLHGKSEMLRTGTQRQTMSYRETLRRKGEMKLQSMSSPSTSTPSEPQVRQVTVAPTESYAQHQTYLGHLAQQPTTSSAKHAFFHADEMSSPFCDISHYDREVSIPSATLSSPPMNYGMGACMNGNYMTNAMSGMTNGNYAHSNGMTNGNYAHAMSNMPSQCFQPMDNQRMMPLRKDSTMYGYPPLTPEEFAAVLTAASMSQVYED